MNTKYRHIDFAYNKKLSQNAQISLHEFEYASDHVVLSHSHDFPQVWICTSGRYVHHSNNKKYDCTKGSVCILPPGHIHLFKIPDGETAKLICLDIFPTTYDNYEKRKYINSISNLFLPLFADELGFEFNEYVMLSDESLEFLIDIYKSIMKSANGRLIAASDSVLSLIEQFFSLPEFSHIPNSEHAIKLFETKIAPITHTLTYIYENYAKKIVLSDLTRVSALCQTNLTAYFKKYIGTSFSYFLQGVRIDRARALLGTSEYPLSYISDVCGFSNHAHMVSCFNKNTSQLPKHTRAALKKYYETHSQKKS